MSVKQLTTNEKLQAAFLLFDKEGEGIITAQQIIEEFSLDGEGNAEEALKLETIIQEVSSQGLSEISFEEFVCMMKNLE